MKETFSLPITYDHTLYTNQCKDFKRICVLLHGYLLDGEFMFQKLNSLFDQETLVLAPNGPFMIPQKKGEEFFPKYGWYFFDPHKQAFYINYEPAALYLKNILDRYNPDHKPVTLIGYSQGGYLTPKVAELVPEVNTVIGLACVFRNERFHYRSDVIYHQIHGDNDVVVEMNGALEEWAILKDKGNPGKFMELLDTGHKLSLEFITALKELL